MLTYVTSHRGSRKDLIRCIKSVEKDNDKLPERYEHLIGLDGYTDEERNAIEKKVNMRNVRIYISTKNIGKSAWINRLVNKAKGSIIFFLDSDDCNLQGRTRIQRDYLNKHKDIDCCGSNYLTWSEGHHFISSNYPQNDLDIKANFWLFPYFLYSSMAIKRESYIKYGLYFREDLKAGLDYDFYSRMLSKCRVHNLEAELCIYKISKKGITNSDHTRRLQLITHQNTLEKLFHLPNYDSRHITGKLMKIILGEDNDTKDGSLVKEVNNYKSQLHKAEEEHNYFPEFFDKRMLEYILDEILKRWS